MEKPTGSGYRARWRNDLEYRPWLRAYALVSRSTQALQQQEPQITPITQIVARADPLRLRIRAVCGSFPFILLVQLNGEGSRGSGVSADAASA